VVEKIKPKHPLRVILDTPTLKNKYGETIKLYDDNEFFDFIAVGGSSKYTELQVDLENQALSFEKDYPGKHQRTREEYAFPVTEEMITSLVTNWDLKPEELKLLFIVQFMIVNPHEGPKVILVTERKKLLNYSKYVTNKLPDFTIFSPEEAKIYIDLFCKKHGAYLVKPQHFVNRGLWYLYSMRSKLQLFQIAWSINVNSQEPPDLRDKNLQMFGSISGRVKDMLKAIDEIGMNYYKGSNNDTMEDMLYHFNYWVTLYSGVLDALAWISLYRYSISAPNKNKVELENEDVLAELYKSNPKLKEVIGKNQKIIDLVYEPRNIFIHREMLHGLRLKDYQAGLELNMIDVEGEFLSHIRDLQPVVKGGLNKAGLYVIKDHERYFLEPYRFVKFATREFVSFLNQFITALDYGELLSKDPSLKSKVGEAARAVPGIFDFDDTEFQDTALGY